MSVAETIEQKLRVRFSPTRLKIVDDSGRHAGHAGARPGGETHFTIAIVSPAFAGLGRVARQRLVYETLAADFADGVHALSLSTLAPGEYGPED
jgi:BolA family transcriptional regulator, general stress-responsive regulator